MYQPLPTNEDADVEAYGRLRQGFAEALTEQDKGIDELAKIISRQKTIATSIGTEVVSQNAYWLAIVLLFIGIIVVSSLPKL
ncbi:hypothetical protein QYM36_008427 [Artemia franciscana]|uniref:Uncharacterized protein n=1 Tax=Artemia franciscana TaxID=6661 RepID=A0AA88IBG2_ARTSF|nr:hypothetical protein QYM36_008427 [Artemia franciscana]